MATEEVQYQPKDAISTTINAALIVGGAGLFTSAVSNSLARENVGPLGIITRTGSTITTFGELLGLSCTPRALTCLCSCIRRTFRAWVICFSQSEGKG